MPLALLLLLMLVLVLIAFSLVLRDYENRLRRLTSVYQQERIGRIAAEQRLANTTEGVERLVVAVTPLIEKTDWMTGRWGGQFNTLVAMEGARNAQVDATRRALWEIPLLADATRQVPLLASLADVGQTIATNTTTEDQS